MPKSYAFFIFIHEILEWIFLKDNHMIIQVIFLDLLALRESTRIVNQFLLSHYLSQLSMNEPCARRW